MDATMKNPQFQDIYFPNKRKQQENLIVQQNTDTGFGEMNCYDVAHGITITYNNLNMDSCYRPIIPQQDFLQIDHCLEGCYECELSGGSVSFLGEGDLSVSNLCKSMDVYGISGAILICAILFVLFNTVADILSSVICPAYRRKRV